MAGPELYPSLSPDGERVAFTWTGTKQDNADIYVQQIGAGDPLRLTSDARSDYNPRWSPDGRWIAFLRGDPATPLATSARELRLVAALGGGERKVADLSMQEMSVNPMYLEWCPDSRCVIVTDRLGTGKPDALFVITLEGEKRALTNPQPPTLADTNPMLSPDGRTLLFIRRSTWAFGDLYIQPISRDLTVTGDPRRVPVDDLKIDYAIWMPDGDELLFSTPIAAGSSNLWRVPVRGGPAARLAYVGDDGVMPTVVRPAPDRSARLVYVHSLIDDNIWRLSVTAAGTAQATTASVAVRSTKQDIHPQLSPDGKRLAFTSTRSGSWEIWVSDLEGANALQLTQSRGATGTGAPHWSPDGSLIAFASDVEGQFDVFVVPARGGKPRNISAHPGLDHVPTFSADGKSIYFSSTRTGQFQIWRVPVDGGEPVQVTKDGGWYSQASNDGQYLYYMATAAVGAPTPILRMPTGGGPSERMVDAAVNSAFAVTDGGIYYVVLEREVRVDYFAFATRRTSVVAANLGTGADIGGITASPDGRQLYFVRLESAVDDLILVENFR